MVWKGEKREAVGQAERFWHGKSVRVSSSFYCLTVIPVNNLIVFLSIKCFDVIYITVARLYIQFCIRS